MHTPPQAAHDLPSTTRAPRADDAARRSRGPMVALSVVMAAWLALPGTGAADERAVTPRARPVAASAAEAAKTAASAAASRSSARLSAAAASAASGAAPRRMPGARAAQAASAASAAAVAAQASAAHAASAASAVASTAASAADAAKGVAVGGSATDQRAAVKASKDRGNKMAACREDLESKGLRGVELRAAIANCMKN